MKTNNLFINKIKINWEEVPNKDEYPFNIETIKNIKEINFKKNVTFLIGENGAGKSSILEAIAIKYGLNPEGGSNNFNFSTYDSYSNLHEYLTIITNGNIPRTKYFLRAESFYNVASNINNLKINDYYKGVNFHNCSHGEAFLELVKIRFYENGFYILDEPEAALSPIKQMSLLCLINDLANKGCQFIIATHSPILISYYNGEILDLDNNLKEVKYKDTNIYKTYELFLNNYESMQEKLFKNIE